MSNNKDNENLNNTQSTNNPNGTEDTSKQGFVRGEWKRELTAQEQEIKTKRSEAAKKAQETRRAKKEQAEQAAAQAKKEFAQRVPTKQRDEIIAKPDTAAQPIEETMQKNASVVEDTPKITRAEQNIETESYEKALEDEILTLNIQPKKSANTQKAKKAKAKKEKAVKVEYVVEDEAAILPNTEKLEKDKPQEKMPRAKADETPGEKAMLVKKLFSFEKKTPKQEKLMPKQDVKKQAKADAKAEKKADALPAKQAEITPQAKEAAIPAQQQAKPAVVKREIVSSEQAQPTIMNKLARKTKARKRLIKIKMLPMLFVLENFFYEIGFYAEYALVGALRVSKRLSLILMATFGKSLMVVLKPFRLFLVGAWHTVADPIARIVRGVKNIRTVIRDEKDKGWKVAAKEAFIYLTRGIKDYNHLASNLVLWAVSVAALVVFIVTVSNTLSQKYVLELTVNGNFVGFVQNEETFEQAKQEIQKQLVYTNEKEQSEPWTISPVYNVTTLGSHNIYNSEEVITAILNTSGKDIVKATGFYVDGQFYGATTDRLQLEQDIESFKTPYYDGDADTTVAFVQDVQLVDGVFIADSIVEYTEISSLLGSTKTGDVNYVIQKGDTLSGIASANGITQNELMALNPQLEGGNATYYPGDVLLMQKAQAFLQVKVIKRVVEQVEIPFAETTSQSSDLGFGKRKVAVEGQAGSKDVTSDITYIDGVMVNKTIIEEVITKEPVTQEVIIGTYIAPGVVAIPGTGQLMWPVPGYRSISRGFVGPFPAHDGVDIAANYGIPIYASDNGVVTKAAYTSRGYGVHVIINHGNGLSTLYAHCSSLTVTTGQQVTKGQLIGYIGSTGWSTGNHCHYEVQVNGVRVNPMRYF